MAPLRPFLILALLAWISLADQGMGVIGGHLGQCRVGRLPGLSCKDWCSLPQSHARAAARRGLWPPGSVSVTSFAVTIRAAVLTTWNSASPKVCSEPCGWAWGPLCAWKLTAAVSACSDSGGCVHDAGR